MENLNQETTGKSIHISKTLKAPVEQVWRAWTEPDALARWWGPEGFNSTIHIMDVEAGGEWSLTMRGPDGKRYPNKSIYQELVPLKKIVFHHFNPNYTATVLFSEQGTTTQLDWTLDFETAALFEAVVKTYKADEGLVQNVAKLEHYLEQAS